MAAQRIRWVCIDSFSGQGVTFLTTAETPTLAELLDGVQRHAKAFKQTGEPGDGDHFYAERVNCNAGRIYFRYRAPSQAKVEVTDC